MQEVALFYLDSEMQIRYKLNHPKQDRHTKLVWQPGDVKNVTAQVGEVLLRHPDVWEKWERGEKGEKGERAAGDAPATEEIGLPEQLQPTEEPLPVIDFRGMDKATLIDFAEKNYNERLDKRLPETTIRHKVIALFGKHQAEFV
jgi:hypothetical protein